MDEKELGKIANKANDITGKGLSIVGGIHDVTSTSGSMLKQIKKNLFEYPVFISDSIPLNYATAVVANLEQSYAQLTQQLIAMNNVLSFEDIKTGNYFGGLKSDINDYLEYQTNEILRDSVHCEYTMEDGTKVEFHKLDMEDEVSRRINEYYNYEPLSEFNHFFNEADTTTGGKSDDGGNPELKDAEGDPYGIVNAGGEKIIVQQSKAHKYIQLIDDCILTNEMQTMNANYVKAEGSEERKLRKEYKKALEDSLDVVKKAMDNVDDMGSTSVYDACVKLVDKLPPDEAQQAIQSIRSQMYNGMDQLTLDAPQELIKELINDKDFELRLSKDNITYMERREKLKELLVASSYDKALNDKRASLTIKNKQIVDPDKPATKMLLEKDITKLNTGKPFFVDCAFQYYNKQGDIRYFKTMVSIKCFSRIVKGEMLPEVVEYPMKAQSKLMRKAKFRAGEMNFFEYLFNVKSKKQSAADTLDENRRWYKRLYNLAHMQNDALSAHLIKGKKLNIANTIQTFWGRLLQTNKHAPDEIKNMDLGAISEYGLIPNCSLIISNSDVVNIKQKTGIDLLKLSAAKKLCKEMFLLTITVVDTDAESIKTFYADLHQDWDVQSLASVNKTLATLDTAGAKAQEAMKLLNR